MSTYDELGRFKRNKVDRLRNKQQGLDPNSAQYNRLQNRINRTMGEGGWAWSDNFHNPMGGVTLDNPQQTDFTQSGYNQGNIETNSAGNPVTSSSGAPVYSRLGTDTYDMSKFNVQDPNDVLALQKMLFPDDPTQWDAMYGDDTMNAHRAHVNKIRQMQGKDAYTWNDGGTPPINSGNGAANNTTDPNLANVNNSGIVSNINNALNAGANATNSSIDNPYGHGPLQEEIYNASNPDASWEEKNFGEKLLDSMPGVGGNAGVLDFWKKAWDNWGK